MGERNSSQDWPVGSPAWQMLDDLDEQAGTSAAIGDIRRATRVAEAKAARLLAERECPADLIEWGRVHGIPAFAEHTWVAGFLAGMRIAALDAMGAGQDPDEKVKR